MFRLNVLRTINQSIGQSVASLITVKLLIEALGFYQNNSLLHPACIGDLASI